MDKTQPDVITQVLGGIARHAITTVAGGLVADGVIKDSDTTMVVGAGMAIATVAWSWWQKVGQAKALAFLQAELVKLKLWRGETGAGIAQSKSAGPLT